LKGNIPTTNQKVANIRFRKVLKTGIGEEREKNLDFKTENRKVAE